MPKRIAAAAVVATVLLGVATAAMAVKTHITVRVIGKDSKFVGSGMGGALVTIKDADTGELLAQGVTTGTAGNTDVLMRQQNTRRTVLADDKTAKFWTAIDIERPKLLEITAYGPRAQRQSAATASVTQWAIPGKPLTEGNAVMLELPGFVVDVLEPPAHARYSADDAPETVLIESNVTMMCGGSLTPGGLWDADKVEVTAMVYKDDQSAGELELSYAGRESQFDAQFKPSGKGTYTIIVYAYDPTTSNTGLDSTTFVIE